MQTRRHLLCLASGAIATLAIRPPLRASTTAVIEMRGTARGERVWYAPLGLAVTPGVRLHFVNGDLGNSHTATAYHPEIMERPRRIPDGAEPWDSGFLLPGESFEVTLTQPGVYDFYCLPHEHAGMVGRIVVGRPGDAGWQDRTEAPSDLPEAALTGFPPVAEIIARGRVMPEDRA